MPARWLKVSFKITSTQLPEVHAAVKEVYEGTFSTTGWPGRMRQNGLRRLLDALEEQMEEGDERNQAGKAAVRAGAR